MRPILTAAAWLALAGSLLAGEAPTENKFYVSAVELVKNNQHQAAKTLLDLALKDHPESPEVLLLSAECSAKLGKADEARGLYERALAAAGRLGGAQGATSAEKAKAGLKALGAAGPAADPKTPPGAPQIPADAQQFGGHWYKCVSEKTTWHEAKTRCEQLGGELACVTSQEEDVFLTKLTAGKWVWLGGTDEGSEGNWRWVSGETFTYKNWMPGQPSNQGGEEHYLHKNHRGTDKWNDSRDSDGNVRGFICEWTPGKQPTTAKTVPDKPALDDWEVRTWDGHRWTAQPVSKMTVTAEGGALLIKNTTGVHDRAFFCNRRVLAEDFSCEMEIRCAAYARQSPSVQFTSATGENSSIYLKSVGAKSTEWRRVSLLRKGADLTFALDGKPAEKVRLRASDNLAGVIGILVESGDGFEIRGFTVTVGREQVMASKDPTKPTVPQESKPTPASDFVAEHVVEKDKHVHLAYGQKHDSVLLLQGASLRVLDADGVAVLKSLTIERECIRIFERDDYFVALGSNALVLIDKASGKATKTIALEISKPLDLAVHPALKVSYVTGLAAGIEDAKDLRAKQLLVVDETGGRVEALSRMYADRVAIDPRGRYLYASLSSLRMRGYKFDPHIWDTLPDYESIDVLTSFDVRKGWPVGLHINKAPGGNGRQLVVSPDGNSVSFVSGGGYRTGKYAGYTIPVFDAADIRSAVMSYNVGAYPSIIAYHPRFDLVMASTGAPNFFERSTGNRISPPRVELTPKALGSWGIQIFSPGGKHLLGLCKDAKGSPAVRVFPLRMTKEEKAALAQGAQRPVIDESVAKALDRLGPSNVAVAPENLDALRGSSDAPMTTREIASKFSGTVVVVKNDTGSGTGFFVGSKGYILTCAHVLPRFGRPEVVYNITADNKTVKVTAQAEVLRVDEKRDLALIKVPTDNTVPVVHLGASEEVAMGESLSVIGHPGLGPGILEYTMTTGIVSNPRRAVDGVEYIQTNASVNPGSSGSPAFSSKGNVIGLMVLKANLEAVALAVPRAELAKFLTEATKQKP